MADPELFSCDKPIRTFIVSSFDARATRSCQIFEDWKGLPWPADCRKLNNTQRISYLCSGARQVGIFLFDYLTCSVGRSVLHRDRFDHNATYKAGKMGRKMNMNAVAWGVVEILLGVMSL